MRQVSTSFDKACKLDIEVRLGPSATPPVSGVLLDSGFVHATFGLILPTSMFPSGVAHGGATISLWDGTEKDVDTIAEGEIIRVNGEWLGQPLVTPVAFVDGLCPVLGTRVMKQWNVEFHGPRSQVRIDLAP